MKKYKTCLTAEEIRDLKKAEKWMSLVTSV